MLQRILRSSQEALTVTKKRFLRKDWCQSQPLMQRISHDQCLSTTILNRFCYGQCNSFFIPKNLAPAATPSAAAPAASAASAATSAKSGKDAASDSFQSCAFCQPHRTTWTTVTLKCPSLTPPVRRRRVQIVKQCRCMTQDR